MPIKEAPGHKLEEYQSHKGAGLKSGSIFGGKIPDSLKAGAHCKRASFFEKTHDQIMATLQPTEMQVEDELGVEEVVREMLEIEVEEDEGEPF